MNELIRSQRKIIQSQYDKLEKEKNILKRYFIAEDIHELEKNLREMLTPKNKEL